MAAKAVHPYFCSENDNMAAIRRAEAVRDWDLHGGKGLYASGFAELARAAKDGCRVSSALKGSVVFDVGSNFKQFQTKANGKETS